MGLPTHQERGRHRQVNTWAAQHRPKMRNERNPSPLLCPRVEYRPYKALKNRASDGQWPIRQRKCSKHSNSLGGRGDSFTIRRPILRRSAKA